MRDLFYKLSEATIYYRFMGYQKFVSRKQIQDFVYIDHRNDVTIVGTVPERTEKISSASAATTSTPRPTSPKWRLSLATGAEQGHRHVPFEALDAHRAPQRHPRLHRRSARENKPMQAVINKSNCKIRSRFTGNVYSYEMDFE